jgi:hypothetical protein
VRVLSSFADNACKNDGLDALATALAASHNRRLAAVDPEATSEVLRLLSERREDLVAERTRVEVRSGDRKVRRLTHPVEESLPVVRERLRYCLSGAVGYYFRPYNHMLLHVRLYRKTSSSGGRSACLSFQMSGISASSNPYSNEAIPSSSVRSSYLSFSCSRINSHQSP